MGGFDGTTITMKVSSFFRYAISVLTLLMIPLGCQTPPASRTAADDAFSQNNYVAAIDLYGKLLQEKVGQEHRDHAREQIAEAKRRLTTRTLQEAARIGGTETRTSALEARLNRLRQGAVYDDAAGRVAEEITNVQRQLNQHRENIAAARHAGQQALTAANWREAMRSAKQGAALEPDFPEFATLEKAALELRDQHYLRDLAEALKRADLDRARSLRQEFANQHPAPRITLLTQMDADILEVVEDLIPERLEALIAQNRYYEAHLLLNTSTRPSTLRGYAFINRDGSRFYRETAQAALRMSHTEGMGIGYFASIAAFTLDSNHEENFQLRRDFSDDIIKQIQSMVGFLTFDAPGSRQDEGLIFTDTIMTEFSKHLPFGLEIVDRAMMDQIMAQRDTDRDNAIRRFNVQRIIRGSVLQMNSIPSSQTVTRTGLYTRMVTIDNPEFNPEARRRDASIPRTIEVREEATHSYDVTIHQLESVMRVSVQMVDAHTNQLIRINGISQSEQFETHTHLRAESHQAQPLLRLKEISSNLPTIAQTENDMRRKLAEEVVQFLKQGFAGKEDIYLQQYQSSMQRRETTKAFFELAKAHAYWQGTLRQHGMESDAKLVEMLETALIQLAPQLASFHRAPIQVAGRPAAQAQVPAFSERHYAVVIGVSNYLDRSIPTLRYASRDARAFYNYLVNPSEGGLRREDVRLLVDHEATVVNIRSAINSVLRSAQANDIVTIYFAGHGSPDCPERPDQLFLIGYDTQYDDILSTGYPMEDFNRSLRTLANARRIMILADACHSGGIGANFDVATRRLTPVAPRMDANTIAEVAFQEIAMEEVPAEETTGSNSLPRRSIALLSASSAEEMSQEGPQYGDGHGVFTYTLLRGLRGDADINGDGAVTLGEIISFVQQEVPRQTNNAQNPTVSGTPDSQKVLIRHRRW